MALTPYERIMRAAEKGKGVVLSADEVFAMSRDDAIETTAFNFALAREREAAPKVEYTITRYDTMATQFRSKGAATAAFNRYRKQADAAPDIRCELEHVFGGEYRVKTFEPGFEGYLERIGDPPCD